MTIRHGSEVYPSTVKAAECHSVPRDADSAGAPMLERI